MKTCESVSNKIVGHLPTKISHPTKFLLQFGAVIKATLPSTNYRNSPLLQGGLQISCQGSVSMPATLKKANYWKVQRYGQCFVRWTRWLCSTGLISSPYDWDSKTFTKKNLWHCSCHLIDKRRKYSKGCKDILHNKNKKKIDSNRAIAKICYRVELTF